MTKIEKPLFARYVGIDYSGAETPADSLKGLRVYMASANTKPTEVLPPPGPKKYWTRRGIAEWLVKILNEEIPTIVGIDHGFSFPVRYFEEHSLEHNWHLFLDDFQKHWPTDEDIYVEFVREGVVGRGDLRKGSARWRRLAETRAGSAKSVFHFDVQGSVAKSTHAGIPWLRFINQSNIKKLHFWPFDGWIPEKGISVISEVYPSLWSRSFSKEDRTSDQHDAYSVARWLQQQDLHDGLLQFFAPALSQDHKKIAEIEGWILGVA